MIAIPANGIPTTSFIGADDSSLSWTVNQPAGKEDLSFDAKYADDLLGSQLLLLIVDSEGASGGVPNSFFPVSGEDSCTFSPQVTD